MFEVITTQSEANNRTYKSASYLSKGAKYDSAYCVEKVHDEGRWPGFHQCRRKRGYGPAKLYCRIHDPSAVKKRDEEKSRKFDRQMNHRVVPWEAVNLIKRVNSPNDITPAWLNERASILKRLT